MSAFGGKADIGLTPRNVRFWPKCMVRPCVARRFDELVVSGLALMYQTSDWSLAPGRHGYQRAGELISGKASTGHVGHQCSHALGRPNLHLVSSSRRPRRV